MTHNWSCDPTFLVADLYLSKIVISLETVDISKEYLMTQEGHDPVSYPSCLTARLPIHEIAEVVSQWPPRYLAFVYHVVSQAIHFHLG